jgi:pimeloyl-ACP methyl ester carboxylesterase/DNA-binding CsgD family transcriptional regulator
MEQDIRFCKVDGRRVAYATVGEGPLLVFGGGRFVSHLEEEWDDPRYRAFIGELARTHRVVRFDRVGVGLSDRDIDASPTNEGFARTMATVLDTFGDEPASFFAVCTGGPGVVLYAIERPDRVQSLIFFGAFASRRDIPPEKRASLVEFVRTNWGLGSQLLASVINPRASGDDLLALAAFQRRAASAPAAAAMLELELESDISDLLPNVDAPALVLHRRGDRAVPIACGREVASLLPRARFLPVAGEAHAPWLDERGEVLRAVRAFLDAGQLDGAPNGDSPLTRRETEVLRLVATGLSNREIATSLIVSEHTVHRHVANILRKLAQPTRAGAAAYAARDGLI